VKNVKRCRATALLCRQQAVLHPEASWHWLAEAERYEDLAEAEIEAHFKECNGGVELDAKYKAPSRRPLPPSGPASEDVSAGLPSRLAHPRRPRNHAGNDRPHSHHPT